MATETAGAARPSRKARTRGALIAVAQKLLAEGRTDVPVLSITTQAGVGLGSFYNHFTSKEALFEAALDAGAEAHGEALDVSLGDIRDPAEVFAVKFRLTGRYFRIEPNLTRALIVECAEYYGRGLGLVASVRRNLEVGVEMGRFEVGDIESVVGVVIGGLSMLGQRVQSQPEVDDGEVTDLLCVDMLKLLGIPVDEARGLATSPLPEFAPNPFGPVPAP